MRHPKVLGLALLLLAGAWLAPPPSRADDDAARHRRTVDPTRRVTLPFTDLTLASGQRLTEGPRSLRDTFPYLAFAPERVSSTNALALVPSTLPRALAAPSTAGGVSPAPVRTAEGAIDAVRMFLAGPLVTDAATGARLLATGQQLAERLEHFEVEVTERRPSTWTPHATKRQPAEGDAASGTWDVSLVAFELDRILELVHVEAQVTAAGEVTLERHAIVSGPYTTWQTSSMGEADEGIDRMQAAMHAEVAAARKAYAAALRPTRTADAFWAVGRVIHEMEDVRALFGEPDRDIGSGIHIWTYDLPDGTAVVFGGGARIVYVRHVRGARGPLADFETLGTFYVSGGR